MEKIVFVVDDNDSNLTAAALALENDYKVLTLPSAQKMFMLLEKRQPCLILLDIEMPEMDGFEACQKLKQSDAWKNIPIVFLTGHDDEAVLSRVKETGAAGVIKKPFTPSGLLESVKKYAG